MECVKLCVDIIATIATVAAVIVALFSNRQAKKNSKKEIAAMKEQVEQAREQEQNRILSEKIEAATVITTLIPQMLYSLCHSEYPPTGISFKCDYSKYISVLRDELNSEELAHLTKIFSLSSALEKRTMLYNLDTTRKEIRHLREGILDGFPGEKEYCQNIYLQNNSKTWLPSTKIVQIKDKEQLTLDFILNTCNSAYCKHNGKEGIHSKLKNILENTIG